MPTFDTVIAGGTVIDGRNLPRRRADVAIKDGRIAEIGRIARHDASNVIEADGLIVAPGFVDLHTHYDAQLFWDPYCSISGWHGVTSVQVGNCGFGFAPAREEDQDYLMRSLNRVEALPYASLKEALPWDWRSFPEWMDKLDSLPKGVNVQTYVPLNPLLINVMGREAAKTRDATDAERDELCRLLREAMDAGASGWSAQRTPPGSGADVQRDHDGTPFATDLMSNQTALALAEVLADYDASIETTFFTGDARADRAHMEELARVSNSPLLYNAVSTDSRNPLAHRKAIAWIRRCQEAGLPVYAQCESCASTYFFTFEDWNLFDDSDAWREATLGSTEERLRKLGDPARRAALKEQRPNLFDVDRTVILKTHTDKFLPVKGMMVRDGAAVLGYADPVDLLLDILVADELKTLCQIDGSNDDDVLLQELVASPFALWGISDGGAHTKFITHGCYPTEHIIKFTRDNPVLTLEEAHNKLSALPAYLTGLKDRGTLVPGSAADIVVYDYDNLRLLDDEVAEDLPAGEWRRVRKADGYRYTIVNGETTYIDGKETGTTSGTLLRNGK